MRKLLLVTLCDQTAETGVSFQTYGRMDERNRTDGQTDVEIEIVIQICN